ncbi:MAG: integrase zinc binding domain-containing protein, partial [Bacteroidota bacterium]
WLEDAIDGSMPTKLRYKLSGDDSEIYYADEEDLGDLADAQADELYATLPEPTPEDPSFEPVTVEEMLAAQWHDDFCTLIRQDLNTDLRKPFYEDDNGLLCRHSNYGVQVVVPANLRAKILYVNHYSRQSGHPGGKKMYEKLRRHFYWPSIATDCYATVKRYPTCAKNRIKLRRNV